MNHPERDSTIYNIKKSEYYWINIKADVVNYIQKCVVCAKFKNIQKNEKNKCLTILSRGTKDRYVCDIWYLPEELL